jgi:hypothetical protein
MFPFPSEQKRILTLEHAPPGFWFIISIAQQVQDTMKEEEPDFAAERMADAPSLEGGLLEIDGDVPLKRPLEIVTERNDVCCVVDAAVAAVEFPDALVPHDVDGQFDRLAHFLRHEHECRQGF